MTRKPNDCTIRVHPCKPAAAQAAGATFGARSVSANHIARWNGSTWQTLGRGLSTAPHDLALYDGDLIAAGDFTMAGGVSANRVARWNGAAWQALGDGLTGCTGFGCVPRVRSLAVYGNHLFAAGNFTTAGENASLCLARWACAP